MEIHPTALIAPTAKIGKNVKVGAYAIIEDDVEIGDHCVIDAHAFIRQYVKMGSHNIVHPYAIIGGSPQDISFDSALKSYVVIGDHNVFREGSSIHRASQEGEATRIGSGCYLMTQIHIGHDCVIGNGCIFASYTALGGHVVIDDKVNFGAGAEVHQFCRIGSLAMIAAGLIVLKDVLPFSLVAGTPVRHYRLNLVGLRRNDIIGETFQGISKAFTCLRKREDFEALTLPQTPEIEYMKRWIAAPSKRGVYGFVSGKTKNLKNSSQSNE